MILHHQVKESKPIDFSAKATKKDTHQVNQQESKPIDFSTKATKKDTYGCALPSTNPKGGKRAAGDQPIAPTSLACTRGPRKEDILGSSAMGGNQDKCRPR